MSLLKTKTKVNSHFNLQASFEQWSDVLKNDLDNLRRNHELLLEESKKKGEEINRLKKELDRMKNLNTVNLFAELDFLR